MGFVTVVLIVQLHASVTDVRPEQIEADLRTLRPDVEWVSAGERLDAVERSGEIERAELAFFAEGHRSLAAGKRALERVELDEAEKALGTAENTYTAHLSWAGAPAMASRAALLRGLALYQSGRTAAAEAAFRRARALDRDVELTETMARPDVVTAFRRTSNPASEKLPLTIANPGHADLYIDGVVAATLIDVVSSEPSTIQLGRGPHFIEARKNGFISSTELVDLQAPTKIELTLSPTGLTKWRAQTEKPFSRSQAQAFLKEIGGDGVWMVALTRDAGQQIVLGQRIETQCATPVVSLEWKERKETMRALGDRLQKDKCEPDAASLFERKEWVSPRPAPPPKVAKPSFFSRPWFWVGTLLAVSVIVIVPPAVLSRPVSYTVDADASRFAGAPR